MSGDYERCIPPLELWLRVPAHIKRAGSTCPICHVVAVDDAVVQGLRNFLPMPDADIRGLAMSILATPQHYPDVIAHIRQAWADVHP